MFFARIFLFAIVIGVCYVVGKYVLIPMVRTLDGQRQASKPETIREKSQRLRENKDKVKEVDTEINLSEELVDVSATLAVKEDKLVEIDMVLEAQEKAKE